MKKILISLGVVIAILLIVILGFFKKDQANPYTQVSWGKFGGSCKTENLPKDNFGKKFSSCDYSVPKEEIPTFKNAKFPFENKFDGKKSLPIMGSAIIDIDNDGVDEVFVAGGVTQNDALFKYENGDFVDITIASKLPNTLSNTSTFGAVSFDLDSNGFVDLLLTGDYGVLWYKNTGDGFLVEKIEVPLNDKSVAASLTIGDINKDGYADLFVSAYIKLDKMEGQTIFKDFNYGASSLLMINNGNNTFKDVTAQYGLTYIHNTFMGIFVDIDNDSWLDLVVAHDTGEVRTYKNEAGQKYTKKANPTTGNYAYPMGIAVGDYNNDGLVDFFFSNTGTSVPEFLARGDLAQEDTFIGTWMLFKNEGDFQFTDVAKETKIADFEFSWGALFEDFDLDGKQDLVVSENYVAFPPHKLFKLPGRFLTQHVNETFAAVEDQSNTINKNYGITPLTSDFNKDGYPDLIFTNIGSPMKAKINKGGNANYIAFRFPETVKYIGSRIVITKTDNSILSDTYIIGEGLVSDQTSTITFGLGTSNTIKSATIFLPNGEQKTIENPDINKTHQM